MTNELTFTLRVPSRLYDFISDGDNGLRVEQAIESGAASGFYADGYGHMFEAFRLLFETEPDRSGARRLKGLSAEQLLAFEFDAAALMNAASDGIRVQDAESLADHNAAAAVIRGIDRELARAGLTRESLTGDANDAPAVEEHTFVAHDDAGTSKTCGKCSLRVTRVETPEPRLHWSFPSGPKGEGTLDAQLPACPGRPSTLVSVPSIPTALRCEANARRGTGTGTCGQPLDVHGQCLRASDHLDA
ncbi:hypothetical protein [Amycolatopsis sp. TNS106]|uniref:hypothetical protein n=1 Tax=Amycolatopsis sp. TNS106 TaxID=2861750 RepID=UPI001C577181|nr:hypothetical protein [Amycolatopsis sp. TNS106]QXV57428.1 hypothetical protein CVV72_10795 [Amycolatopsis sp. TNS106]